MRSSGHSLPCGVARRFVGVSLGQGNRRSRSSPVLSAAAALRSLSPPQRVLSFPLSAPFLLYNTPFLTAANKLQRRAVVERHAALFEEIREKGIF